MRLKQLCVMAVATLSVAAHSQIVEYTAPGGSFDPTSVNNRVTAGALNDTGSSADLQPGVGLPDTVFLQQNILSPDPASAVANNQFFQFAVQAHLGFHLNLSNLAFKASRGGASTPRGWVLRSSVDGFGSDLGSADVPTQNPNLTQFSVDLSGSPFQNLVNQIVFRVYGYAPSTGVGMFYDDLILNGAVLEDPILAKYTAPGGSFLATTLGDHVLASALNDLDSQADLQPGVALADTVFLQQNVASPDPASAVANNQYFQFTVAAETGFALDMSSLTFDATRGGASTPRGWVLRSSLDNFGADIATGEVPTQNPTLTGFGVDLSGSMFQNVTQQVTFRIYGYAPSAGVGMFYDNIALHGSVQAVPEPASLVALGAGIALMLRRRRRA